LSAMALSLHADLIVMGCYGHGVLRERIFGGATRSMLAGLPAPVLMAH
jgi:nucleotide-binding universal stress UspA family protein